MFTLFEQEEEFYKQNENAKGLLTSIISDLGLSHNEIRVEKNIKLDFNKEQVKNLHILHDGFVRIESNDHLLYFLEPGDLINIPNNPLCSSLITNSELCVREYDYNAFFKALQESSEGFFKWQEYNETLSVLLNSIIAQKAQADSFTVPEVRHYVPGDAIIIEETKSHEVFTLLHGAAKAYVKDTFVGEVLRGEIFGSMAATSNSRRTASVIAETSCIVSVLPQERFLELVYTHPNTVHQLINSMSRIILSQNEMIISQ